MTVAQVLFLVMAAVTITGAVGVLTSRLVQHAALFLVFSFLGVAGVYVLMNAGFLAAVQILVYVGAVTTMIVFAVMFSDIKEVEVSHERSQWWKALNREAYRRFFWGMGRVLVPVTAAAFLVITGGVFLRQMALSAAGQAAEGISLNLLAHALFTTYALPFEVASVLLLAALIGAVVLSRKEGE